MTSDEKRSKVAERLRILASHAPSDKDYVLDALGLYPGEYIDGFDPYCVNELADLIDRQTCEVKDDNPWASDFDYVCRSCGEHFSTCDKPNYCPGCGARVVRDDAQ